MQHVLKDNGYFSNQKLHVYNETSIAFFSQAFSVTQPRSFQSNWVKPEVISISFSKLGVFSQIQPHMMSGVPPKKHMLSLKQLSKNSFYWLWWIQGVTMALPQLTEAFGPAANQAYHFGVFRWACDGNPWPRWQPCRHTTHVLEP